MVSTCVIYSLTLKENFRRYQNPEKRIITFLTHCWYPSTKFPIKIYNLSWKRMPKDCKFVFCMETCLGKVAAMDNLSWHTLEGTTNVLLWQSGEVRWQEYSILHPLNLITGSLHQTASVIQQEHAGHISF